MTAQKADVEVRAALDAWPGREEVREKVTPVKITVTNTSSSAIRVGANDFELRNERLTFDSIDLDTYDGTVNVPANTVTNPDLMTPSTTVGSNVAATNWVVLEMPTDQMKMSALETTSLAPGESVTGFVYFGDVDSVEDGVQLELVGRFDGADGESVAKVSMPVVAQ